jgi:hypothetical protein
MSTRIELDLRAQAITAATTRMARGSHGRLEVVARRRTPQDPAGLGDRGRQPQRRPPDAAICLAITVLIVGKLLTYRDRYCRA